MYIDRALDNSKAPETVMAAGTFLNLGRRWLKRLELLGAAIEFVSAGIELHPKEAALFELLGDLLMKQGQKDQASSTYRTAFELDPKLGKGATLEEYIAARTKVN